MKDLESIRGELYQKQVEVLPFLSSSAPNAIYRLLLDVFSFGLWRVWSFLPEFKKEIEKLVVGNRVGSAEFYRALIFGKFGYVKRVIIREANNGVSIYPLLDLNRPLAFDQLLEIQKEVDSKRPLGVSVWVGNMQLNRVDLRIRYKVRNGVIVDREAISAVINDYFATLSFDEPYRYSALTAFIFMKIHDVVDVYIQSPVVEVFNPMLGSVVFLNDIGEKGVVGDR